MTMQTTELSLTPTAAAEAVVDLDAIAHNVRLLRELAGSAQVMAVVKADGYGHGATQAGRAALAAGAAELGVATIDEAMALRRDGICSPVLAWLHAPGTDFGPALQADVEVAVSSVRQLGEVLDAAERTSHTATITVKVDTGLNRNGVQRRRVSGSAEPAGPRTGRRCGPGCAASCRIWCTATTPTTRSMIFRRSGCAIWLAQARDKGVRYRDRAPVQLSCRHDPPRSGVRYGAARYRDLRADPHTGAR